MPGEASAPLSPRLTAACAGVLLLTAVGTAAAIVERSSAVALATIAWYGVAFAALTWWRPAAGLLGLVAVLPLVTVEVALPGMTPTLSADKLAVAAVCGAWLLGGGLRRLPALARAPAVRWWALYLGVVLLSAVQNGVGVGQLWGVVKQAIYGAAFVMALDVVGALPRLPRTALALAAATGVVVSLLTVAERALWRLHTWVPLYFKSSTATADVSAMLAQTGGATRFGSTLSHPNFLAAYLVLLLPVTAALVATSPRRRVVGGAAVAVMLVGMVSARSAGAAVGLGTAVVAAAVVVAGTRLSRRAFARTLVAGALVLAVIAGAAVARLGPRSPSFTVREAAHRVGLAAIAERPWLGFGENGFAREAPRLERVVYGGLLLHVHRMGESLAAHSAFLQVAVERGLLGAAALAGILVSIVLAGIRRVRAAATLADGALVLGLLTGVLGFLVQGFTEGLLDFSKVSTLFWIASAAILAGAPARDRSV